MTITAFSLGARPVPSINLAPSITSSLLVCCARISRALPSDRQRTVAITKNLNGRFIVIGIPMKRTLKAAISAGNV